MIVAETTIACVPAKSNPGEGKKLLEMIKKLCSVIPGKLSSPVSRNRREGKALLPVVGKDFSGLPFLHFRGNVVH